MELFTEVCEELLFFFREIINMIRCVLDVKPSNILIDEYGTIKLCDFGISGVLIESMAKSRNAGCAAYMSPERIEPSDPTRPDYDIRADIWSLGITLVSLVYGQN